MVLRKTRKYIKYNNLKYNIKKHTRRKDKHKTGGEAIAAGGYGCVFKPVLRCQQMKRNNKRGKNLVSKLLMKEDAFEEMEEIEGILKFIKKNPDNSKYFIINDQVSICKPAPLTKTDLHNYDKVCSGTKVGRNGINSTNINENLDKLNIINQIDGGKDLDVYIQTHYYYKKLNKSERIIEFRKLNTSLINLLNNAIVEINNDGLYHFDIKGSNILVGKDDNTRLIDWGASFVYLPNAANAANSANAANAANANKANTPSSKSIIHSKYNIPQKVFNRSMFQFNIPFSIILFFDNIDNVLLQIQEKSEKSDNSYDLAQKIILLSLKDAGEGHFDLILEYMINIYNYGNKNNKNNKNKFTKTDALKVIIEYISNVLLNFLDFSTFHFNLEKFFNDVVKHNIDVYGFLMSYIDFILYSKSKSKSISNSIKSNNNNEEEEIYKKLAEIIIEFCFQSKYASKRIPVKTLTTKLKML